VEDVENAGKGTDRGKVVERFPHLPHRGRASAGSTPEVEKKENAGDI
jgi:hypothetical protein